MPYHPPPDPLSQHQKPLSTQLHSRTVHWGPDRLHSYELRPPLHYLFEDRYHLLGVEMGYIGRSLHPLGQKV